MPRLRALCLALVLVPTLCGGAGCGADEADEAGGPAAASGASGAAGGAGASGQAGAPSKTLAYDVMAPGPFRAGFRSFSVTYQPKGPVPAREIVVSVWYPTSDTEGEASTYLIGSDLLSFDGATLAPPVDEAGYPVRVHSHGYAAWGGSSAALHRYFASHGWVTVAPDHTGNTVAQKGGKIPLTHHLVRPQDVTAALDALEKLPAGDPLAGKARTERVLMSGHSFGTRTTWADAGARFDKAFIEAQCAKGDAFSEACTPEQIAAFDEALGDARVVAGVPMAGGDDEAGSWYGTKGYDGVKVPMLLMSGTADEVGAKNVLALASGPDLTWVEIEGGCHELFNIGGCKQVPSEEGWALVSAYLLAFGRKHVLGDTSARVAGLLDGSQPGSARVTRFERDGAGGGQP